jgi:hypothetical protein
MDVVRLEVARATDWAHAKAPLVRVVEMLGKMS